MPEQERNNIIDQHIKELKKKIRQQKQTINLEQL